ncbi:MAG: dephospho-CoA kinase, partial [Candidatus Omnitrophica bacterium]|nr:dephospho-CoA kinase [Candidatus Omnitrophota bacterium]
FGTGKSTVAGIMADEGALVIDADRIAHEIIMPGSSQHELIAAHFGKAVLKESGQIDRRVLGKIVFKSGAGDQLDKLCRIVHPEVITIIKKRIKELKEQDSNQLIVLDAPLLFETGLEKTVDKVIVVETDRKKQIERCQRAYNNITEEEILNRINTQMPLEEKIARADFIIDNNGSEDNTRDHVKKFLFKILS